MLIDLFPYVLPVEYLFCAEENTSLIIKTLSEARNVQNAIQKF